MRRGLNARAGQKAAVGPIVSELLPENLRVEFPADALECDTSEELGAVEGIIRQDRALQALLFGLEMKGKGFNVYAAGQRGTGKNTAVRQYLLAASKTRPVPPDWCYVNTFRNPYAPRAMSLPSGTAKAFKKDLNTFVDEAKRAVPAALQSEEFLSRRNAAARKADEERGRILDALNREAAALGFAVQVSKVGTAGARPRTGRPRTDEEVEALPAALREEMRKNREAIAARLDRAVKQVAELESKTRAEVRKLQDDVVRYAIGLLSESIASHYRDVPRVTGYLREVEDDILENVGLFIGGEGESQASPEDSAAQRDADLPFRRYRVNVIVDNSALAGAPLIFEDNPTYTNLFGKIENEARFGALVTDFTLIKAGSLHRANGGYLVVQVNELSKNPASYEGLKRALQSERIAIEEAGEKLMTNTKSLTPEAIPLGVKVVLIGDPASYQELYTRDPEFGPLFKVKAQFDETVGRNPSNAMMYARFVHTLCEAEGLRHLESAAIAKVVEHGSRLAGDQAKLSTRFSELADVVREAAFYASEDGSEHVRDAHIVRAVREKVYRSNLVDEKLKEMVARRVILIDTSGAAVGQVNGLTVMDVGDFEFGQPSRVTASVGLGREGIIDIEREAKLGGQIHTKGVLIISGYLAEKYARDKPLSLSCRLVFEQSYGEVEGDSASSAELYAILSALSGLAIRQNLAVTGSVNQKGEVQAIGGVNEKVEGFFDTCTAKGLQGDEGVMIPQSNVQHLMLREDVVDAVRQGRFHVHAVTTIDEGIETLTGVPAGKRSPRGRFEPGSVNARVDERLKAMAGAIARFGGPFKKAPGTSAED